VNIEYIPLEQITPQNTIHNRGGENAILMRTSFMELVSSIRTVGKLIQPIVVKKIGDEEYELHVGHRRFLAYKTLQFEDTKKFSAIPAIVFSGNYSEVKKMVIAVHENKYRENPASIDALITNICVCPFYLDCGVFGDEKKNFELGMKILKRYLSYIRSTSESRISDFLKDIAQISPHENPFQGLDDYFDQLGEKPSTLGSKVSIFSWENEVYELYAQEKIHFKDGRTLNKAFKLHPDDLRPTINELIIATEITKDEAGRIIFEALKEVEYKSTDNLEDDINTLSKLFRSAKKKKKITKKEERKVKEHITSALNILKGETSEKN